MKNSICMPLFLNSDTVHDDSGTWTWAGIQVVSGGGGSVGIGVSCMLIGGLWEWQAKGSQG